MDTHRNTSNKNTELRWPGTCISQQQKDIHYSVLMSISNSYKKHSLLPAIEHTLLSVITTIDTIRTLFRIAIHMK